MIVLMYMLKTLICSAVFYAYYFLVLRDKAFHHYNRFYLLITPLLAILLPLINVPVELFGGDDSDPIMNTLRAVSFSGMEEAFIVRPKHSVFANLLKNDWIYFPVYLTGVVLIILPLLKSFFFIYTLSKKYRPELFGDIRFYNTNEAGTPYSFFKNIFWNRKINPDTEPGKNILRHEMFHVYQYHSFDIVYIEIIKSVFWFNPFYYLVKKELQALHEFLADQYASERTDKFIYAELLVMQAIELKSNNFYHHFFNTEIKRRIIMITKTRMRHYNYFGRLMALPLAFIIFCAFSISMENTGFTSGKSTVIQDTMSMSELRKIDLSDVESFNINDQTALLTMKDRKSILVKKTVLEKFMAELEQAEMAAESRNTEQHPTKAVDPKQLKKPESARNTANASPTPQQYDKTYTKLEIEPAYPGGVVAWTRYLSKACRYPQEAQDKEISGNVIVRFIVDREGNLSDIQAISGPLEGGLREEAIRIVSNSGKWLPGIQNGVKVKAYKNQPVTFKLEAQ